MRAIWKGAVSFGLVSIAVKLYSATEEKDIRFHQVHRTDGGRIKYQRTCSIDGEVVSYDDIAKGYDIGGGEMVILTDEDFSDLPLTTSRAIDVLEFVPADEIDPILFAKAYYLEPEGQAAKPYVLLRDALQDADRVAIVKIALRQREQLATLRVHEGVLVLNTMLWPDEVRAPEFGFLDEDIETRPAELAMASSLIDSMSDDAMASSWARGAMSSSRKSKLAARISSGQSMVLSTSTPSRTRSVASCSRWRRATFTMATRSDSSRASRSSTYGLVATPSGSR